MQKYIEIGKIVGTRGLDGTMKVLTSTTDTIFCRLKNLYVDNTSYNLIKISKVKNFYFIKLKEITDINSADKLKDKLVFVDRENIKLNNNEYFVCDILGLDAFDDNGKFFGKITDIDNFGSKDVYTIKNDKKEYTLCLIDGLIRNVDFEDNKIIFDSKILSEVIVWK